MQGRAGVTKPSVSPQLRRAPNQKPTVVPLIFEAAMNLQRLFPFVEYLQAAMAPGGIGVPVCACVRARVRVSVHVPSFVRVHICECLRAALHIYLLAFGMCGGVHLLDYITVLSSSTCTCGECVRPHN